MRKHVLNFVPTNLNSVASQQQHLYQMVTNHMSFSFEFFPPKTEALEQKLWQAVKELAPLTPRFVSVTYGAGGSTRERTHRIVKRIKEETDLSPAAHLTCVGSSKEEIHQVVRQYLDVGVNHFVALRGDPPKDAAEFTPHPDGYHYANELVTGLKALADVELSVSAYPEKHPEAPSLAFDIEQLKKKQDAGATRAITQYFFEADIFERFLEHTTKAGITIPIVPGILPIYVFEQAVRFSKMCGTTVPGWLHEQFVGLEDDADAQQRKGLEVASKLCDDLKKLGTEHFHFYTLNRAETVQDIVANQLAGELTAA